MTHSTKRNVLLVILAFVIPWLAISVCNIVVSERGGIYQATRSWYVKGVGGRCGALESEATTQVDHSTRHVAYETEFFCGPLRLAFPFSAPIAVGVLAIWLAGPVGVALLLRFSKHEGRDTQVAY